jgi:hypothetical protein
LTFLVRNFIRIAGVVTATLSGLTISGRQSVGIANSGGLNFDNCTVAYNTASLIVELAPGGTDVFMGRLDVLPGDFDDNSVVNNKDVSAIRNEWKGKHGGQPTIFGEILGDGPVTAGDYHVVQKRIGTKLPKIGGKPPEAVFARILVRHHSGVKHAELATTAAGDEAHRSR